MQPHQKKGSVIPFNSYLKRLKPKKKQAKEDIEERNKRALFMQEKAKKLEQAKNG